MYSRNSIFILVCMIFLFAVRFVNAAPGDLDLSFGTNGTGIVSTQIRHSDGTIGYANSYASVVQPDDKIIAVGRVNSASNYDIALVRYNPDGTLDTGFGNAGKAVARVNTSSSEEAYAVALQPDGKILVGGFAVVTYSYSGTRRFFALWRFNPNGTPDYSFGTAGKTLIEGYRKDYQQSHAVIRGLVVQPDGKIVAVGYDYVFYDSHAVIRFHPNGAVDTSLNGGALGGRYYFTCNNFASGGFAAAQQSDGEIVIGGTVINRGGKSDFAAVRFNSLYSSAGTIDSITLTNFPGNGLPGNGFNEAFAVAVQTDDKFVLAGTDGLSFSDYALARYNADGTPDESFGNLGKTTLDFAGGEDVVYGVTIQTDGKIVAAGKSYVDYMNRFSLARFNEDGSTDFDFGTLGKVTTPFLNKATAYSVKTQSDGKIVAVGDSSGLFTLARYEN